MVSTSHVWLLSTWHMARPNWGVSFHIGKAQLQVAPSLGRMPCDPPGTWEDGQSHEDLRQDHISLTSLFWGRLSWGSFSSASLILVSMRLSACLSTPLPLPQRVQLQAIELLSSGVALVLSNMVSCHSCCMSSGPFCFSVILCNSDTERIPLLVLLLLSLSNKVPGCMWVSCSFLPVESVSLLDNSKT